MSDSPQGLAEDLARLTPDALRVVTRWAEDRLCNAVTPLSVRLQMEMPGTLAADVTLQAAARAIERVMAAVEELRQVSRQGAKDARGPDLMALQTVGERAINTS